jgi:hypothetical protein
MIIYIVFAVAGLAAVSVYASNKDKDKKQGVSQNGLSINVSPSTKSSAQSSTQSSSSSPQSDSQSTLKSQSFLQQPHNELNKLIREQQNRIIQKNNDSSKIEEIAEDFKRKLDNILYLRENVIGGNNGDGSDVSGEGGEGEELSKETTDASSSCGSCPGECAENCSDASSVDASQISFDCVSSCPGECAESCNSAPTTSLEASNNTEDCGPCPGECAENCSDASSVDASQISFDCVSSCPGECAESCNSASTNSLEASNNTKDCGPCPGECAENCNSAPTTSLEASKKPEDCGSCPGECAENCNSAPTTSLEASKKPEDCGPCPEPDDCAESCNSAPTTSLEASKKPEDCGSCPGECAENCNSAPTTSLEASNNTEDCGSCHEPDDCAESCSDAASIASKRNSEQLSNLSNGSVVQPMSPEQIDKAAEHIYIIQNKKLKDAVIKIYGDKQNGILDEINKYNEAKNTLSSLFTKKIIDNNIDHVIQFLIELVYLGTFKEYVMVLYPLLFTEKYEVHANTTTNEKNPDLELLIINAYRYKYWSETHTDVNKLSDSDKNSFNEIIEDKLPSKLKNKLQLEINSNQSEDGNGLNNFNTLIGHLKNIKDTYTHSGSNTAPETEIKSLSVLLYVLHLWDNNKLPQLSGISNNDEFEDFKNTHLNNYKEFISTITNITVNRNTLQSGGYISKIRGSKKLSMRTYLNLYAKWIFSKINVHATLYIIKLSKVAYYRYILLNYGSFDYTDIILEVFYNTVLYYVFFLFNNSEEIATSYLVDSLLVTGCLFLYLRYVQNRNDKATIEAFQANVKAEEAMQKLKQTELLDSTLKSKLELRPIPPDITYIDLGIVQTICLTPFYAIMLDV